MFKTSATTCSLLFGLLSAPMYASAQQQDSTIGAPPQATDLDAVSVHAERYDARRDDTASRIVFNTGELGRHGDTTLVDALKRLPGVTVGNSQPGRSGSIALRGMGAGYTQILVNGQAPIAGFDIDSLTPEMVERVEILRAPTAEQRAEGVAGTINIVLASIRRGDSDKLTMGAATASNGRRVPSMTWVRSRQQDEGSHSLAVATSKRDFLVEEGGAERITDPEGNHTAARSTQLRAEGSREVVTATASKERQLGDDNTLRLTGTAEASRFARATDIEWNTSSGPELQSVAYQQRTGIDVSLLQGTAKWIRQSASGGSLDATLGANGNRERNAYQEHGQDSAGAQSMEERTDSRLSVHEFSSQGGYTLPDTGAHAFKLGWEASLARRKEDRVQSIRNFGNEADQFSDLSFEARVRRLALYAQDEFKISSPWSMYLGVRLEHIEIESGSSDVASIRNRRQVLSPIVQSLWKIPESSDRIRLSLSRTFKSPSLASLLPRPYTTTNNRPMNPDQIGNPRLRPELSTGLDLAYETESDGVQFNVGGYLRRIEDVVRKELHLADGRWILTPVNGGEATAWGLEMDGSMPLSTLFKTAPEVEIRFNATRAWSHVDDVPSPDNRIAEQTPFSATLAADGRINRQWSAGASYSYRSNSTIQTTPVQTDINSPKRELDIYAVWSMRPGTKLRLSASNVLAQHVGSGQRYVLPEGEHELTRDRRGVAMLRAQLEIQL